MDQELLGKALIERTELEYLFDDNQWLPAIVSGYQAGTSHSPYVTLQLLQHPREHSGGMTRKAVKIDHSVPCSQILLNAVRKMQVHQTFVVIATCSF